MNLLFFIIIASTMIYQSKTQIPSPAFCYDNKYEYCIKDRVCVWCINGTNKESHCIPWIKRYECNFNNFETIYETDQCQDILAVWKIFFILIGSIIAFALILISFFNCVTNKKSFLNRKGYIDDIV